MEYFNMIRKKAMGLTDAQDELREATNNEQWGPTSKQQQKIVQYTFHYQECHEIMEYLYRRLGEDGKNWRIIYKSLLVLDNILKNGSEEAVNYALMKTVEVKTLQSFQKIDENGKDVGINVRERSKQIMEMLNDKDYLKQVREDAKKQKKDYGGMGNTGFVSSNNYSSSSYYSNNDSFRDDFDNFANSSSNVGYSYNDEPKQTYENQNETGYKDEPVQQSFGQPGSYKDEPVQQSFGKPGSYKDAGYENTSKQMPKHQTNQLQTNSNLFDMLDNQQNQQFNQPQQQQFNQPQQRQQQNSMNLFEFDSAPQQQQRQQPQQQNSMDMFGWGAPSQSKNQQAQQQIQQQYQQPNAMDLFSGMTVTPTQPMQTQPQQPQYQQPQQQSNQFDFGDFTSAPSQQPKQNDWRSNIRIDSLQDNRKQNQQPKPQPRQTLGGTFL